MQPEKDQDFTFVTIAINEINGMNKLTVFAWK